MEKEWFSANNCRDIANAANAAARSKAIKALADKNPPLYASYRKALREYAAFSHFLHHSEIYPLCGRGDINLYAVFAEWMRENLNPNGLLGAIVPSGIASDDTTKFFFQDLMEKKSLASLYDFENGDIFPAVDSRYKFSLLTCNSGELPLAEQAYFVFFAKALPDLKDEAKRFSLNSTDLCLLNPNTRTCPIFRSKKDAILAKAIYRRHPILIQEDGEGKELYNPWSIKFFTMFHMANDSGLFRSRKELEFKGFKLKGNIFIKGEEKYLPLYEAKMIHHFNHRWATYEEGKKGPETRQPILEELQDPDFLVQPRYWVTEEKVNEKLDAMGWEHEWFMGFRDVTNVTNERTIIGSIFPLSAVGNKLPIWTSESNLAPYFTNLLSSFACDYFARFKVGGISFGFFIAQQIAVPAPENLAAPTPWQPEQSLAEWLKPRILELTYTAEDMRPFAEDLDYYGPPFPWNEERRAQIRAELDAAFFHLYLPSNAEGGWQKAEEESEQEFEELRQAFPNVRDAVEYIMESFPITREKDMKKYGEYRTKNMILENYDAFAEAMPAPAKVAKN